MAVRKDEYFQTDMSNASVRSKVDAVIADPNQVTECLHDREAMACLDRLRALRDVLKRNGGGPIEMDTILQPWSSAAEKQLSGVHHAPLLLFPCNTGYV